MIVQGNPFHTKDQLSNGGVRRRIDPQTTAKKSRRRAVHSLHLPSNGCFRKLIRRSFWCVVAATLFVPFVFSNYGLLILFLNGPKVEQDSISVGMKPRWNRAHTDDRVPYRPPESPRSAHENVYKAPTKAERQLFEAMKKTFHGLEQSGKIVPCGLDKDCWVKEGSSFSGSKGQPRILLRNPLEEDRYWCGMRLLGKGGTLDVTEVPKKCKEEPLSYIYSNHPPNLSGKSTPPVELFWNYGEDSIADVELPNAFPCSTPCRSEGSFAIVNNIIVRNTKWQITFSMEGEKYFSEVAIRPGAYRENRFYATTSFHSEIPLPYFSWAEYNITNPEVDFDTAIKGASFLAGNCNSLNNREDLVRALINTTLRVDSLSSCLNNAESPPGISLAKKIDVMHAYLFHLAFENQNTEDYITEKVWGALEAGTLPVYFGAPNIKENIPANSVIFVDDYESPQDLAAYLVRLTLDKDLYRSYHKWRYQPLDPGFAGKYDFTHTHSTCRMCRWAFAKRHGLGWNHSKQEVVEPFIAHKTCRNKFGLIGHPFKEYWLLEGDQGAETNVQVTSIDSTKTCELNDRNRVIEIDRGAVSRRVFDHDGVTDLIVEKKAKGIYILQLACPINATNLYERYDGSNFVIRWWQDSQSRMTIVASDNITTSVLEPGILQIPISSHVARVRVIVEDVDHFHKGTAKVLSYFGDLMSRDFFSPLEAYRVID
jgi:hypothetical protein